MNTLTQILRNLLFLALAVFGTLMALIFMASTAIAVAILYVVARLTGRPFGARAYWEQRRRPRTPQEQAARKPLFNPKDVTDIEMRETP